MEQLNESLICNICQKKFDRKRDLKQHYFHHDVLSCDVCEKVFDHPKNLKRHYRVHTVTKQYQCEDCPRKFTNLKSFNKHCHTCSEKKKDFACHECEKQFYTKDHLKKHIATHKSQKSFKCNVCLKIFFTLGQLTKHLSTHRTQKAFSCNVCTRQFIYKQSLIKHLQTHLQKCSKCAKEFYSKQKLKSYHLYHCGKTCLTELSEQKKLSDVETLMINNLIWEKNGIYECKECEKTYNNKRSFRRHLDKHEGKCIACDVCDKSFIRKDHLLRHYKLHTKKKLYKCRKCSKIFFNFTNLKQHKLIHSKAKGSVSKKKEGSLNSQSDDKNFYSCIKNSSIPYVLLEKLKIHDTEKSYIVPKEKLHACDVCKRRFCKKWDLKRHQSAFHKGEKLHKICKNSYRCKKCPKVFSNLFNLKQHKLIHTREKGSVSEKRKENLDSQSNFTNHYSSIKFKTSLKKLSNLKHADIKTKKKSCESKIPKKKYNYRHVLQKYLRMHSVGKSFICDVCGKTFYRQNIFENHCLSHSGVKPYKCVKCDKRFFYKNNLRQHMIIHKPKKIISPFDCEVCMKKFTSLYPLQRHSKIHKKNQSYVCNICMKNFSSSYSLKRHSKIHNRDKSHVCKVCQKKFANAKRLNYHQNLYKGKQAYGCSECEMIFHLRSNLNRHLVAHENESYQCNKCLKKFVNQKSLQAHKDVLCGKNSSVGNNVTLSDESNLNETLNSSITKLKHSLEIYKQDKNKNICNICQKSFVNARLFQYHLDTYKNRQIFECTKCAKKFHYRQSLIKHLRIHKPVSVHQHIDVHFGDKFSLSNIAVTFSDESYLNKQQNPSTTDLEHQSEIQSEDSNNICNVCKKSFTDSRLFRYHLDTYKGRQAYQCPECAKKFHTRVNLNKHLLVHKSLCFQCDVCHKTFADPVSLEQHIHVLSGDRTYECNIEDMFSGESIKDLIDKRLGVNKELNHCTTEKPCVIYVSKELQK